MEALNRLLGLLIPKERRELRKVLALAMGAAFLEMLAVLSVLPFMAVVSDPIAFLDHPVALWAYDHFGIWRARDLLLLGGSGVLVLVVSANAAAALSLRKVQLTAWNINHFLSCRLLESYLLRPYSWFLNRHSSGLQRSLLEEVRLVVQGVLLPLLSSAVRGSAALLLVILLLIVDPGMTLVAGFVLGVTYLLIYFGVRSVQERLGTIRTEAAEIRFQVATEVLGGIKEVKSLGVERQLLSRFEDTGPAFVRATAWSSVVAELPRHVLEVLSVGTVLAILLYLLTSGQTVDEALPVLALFAFAGYKLVPAFHQIFTGATVARFYLASLRDLERDLGVDREARLPDDEGAPLQIEEAIELQGVTFRYPGALSPSLHGIDLRIARGERIGVVGPTGAGKTTLVDLLLGLLEPESGNFLVDGASVEGADWLRWRKAVGYVPQSIFLVDDTIAGNIAFGVAEEAIDQRRLQEVAQMAEVDRFAQKLPEGYHTLVGERGVRLSGGQRQRIGIARALYRNPSLLLLDEATSALDGTTEGAVMKAVFGLARERTIVIVAHRLSTVRDCDRIVVLEGGRLSAVGSWDELMRESELFRALVHTAREPERPDPTGA